MHYAPLKTLQQQTHSNRSNQNASPNPLIHLPGHSRKLGRCRRHRATACESSISPTTRLRRAM